MRRIFILQTLRRIKEKEKRGNFLDSGAWK